MASRDSEAVRPSGKMMEAHLKSSHIAHAAWLDKSGAPVLTLTFTNGDRYAYEGAPQSVYDGLRQAESAGDYFHKHILGRFEAKELGPDTRELFLGLPPMEEAPLARTAYEARRFALEAAIRLPIHDAASVVKAAKVFMDFLRGDADK